MPDKVESGKRWRDINIDPPKEHQKCIVTNNLEALKEVL